MAEALNCEAVGINISAFQVGVGRAGWGLIAAARGRWRHWRSSRAVPLPAPTAHAQHLTKPPAAPPNPPPQVEHANRFAASRGLSGRAKFLVADGMAPPFEDGSFDVVVSVESAAYMPDKK
jgi:hypothetical protein